MSHFSQILTKSIKRVASATVPTFYFYEKTFFNRGKLLETDKVLTASTGQQYSINGLVQTLMEKGVVVLDSFYDAAMMDSIYQQVMGLNQEVESGEIEPASKFKGNPVSSGRLVWSDMLRDRGMIRINKVEDRLKDVRFFTQDPDWITAVSQYYGRSVFNMQTISQYNEPADLGCRSYHIDSAQNQFKAFLYLTDVESTNGPFEYVEGSHLINWKNLKRVHKCLRNRNTTVSESEVAESGLKSTPFPAQKGTVILADTRGIHRGQVLDEGHRVALVNYYCLKEDYIGS